MAQTKKILLRTHVEDEEPSLSEEVLDEVLEFTEDESEIRLNCGVGEWLILASTENFSKVQLREFNEKLENILLDRLGEVQERLKRKIREEKLKNL